MLEFAPLCQSLPEFAQANCGKINRSEMSYLSGQQRSDKAAALYWLVVVETY